MLLKLGSSGPDVAALVDRLRAHGFQLPPGAEFNAQVKRTVEAFQSANIDALGRPLAVDGKVGEHTSWALSAAALPPAAGLAGPAAVPNIGGGGSAAGRAALRIALAEAARGAGESGSNNNGADVVRYLNGTAPPANWCAALVSWCFQQAIGEGNIAFGYCVGAQAVHNRMRKLGHAYPATLSQPPEPGDIIVWRRVDPADPRTGWQGHIGLIVGFANGYLTTVEGNRGPFPSKVATFQHSWADIVASQTSDRFKGLFGLSRHP
jgi:hypothetical protein